MLVGEPQSWSYDAGGVVVYGIREGGESLLHCEM